MRYLIITLFAFYLSGCASNEVKAPCNYQGSFCGQKMKINQ